MDKPTYQEFLKNLKDSLNGRADASMAPYAHVVYETVQGPRPYDLMKICSATIGPDDPVVIIRATIHGDEPGGSYTLMNHVGEIFDYAHARGVRLIIYPMDNPSGYEAGTRYNIENDTGDGGNNDGLRYELNDGTIVGGLGRDDTFKRWIWASEEPYRSRLTKETLALHDELKTLPLAQVRAIIDIHQDNYLTAPGTYFYAYGDTSRYHGIVTEIEKLATVFKNENIDSGYLAVPGSATVIESGVEVQDTFDTETDALGCIVRHDGSITDLFDRLGTPHAITIETTTQLPQDIVDQVNLAWIHGIIDLVHQGPLA